LIQQGIVGSIEERATNGWIVLEPLINGFDRNAIVVMQPQGKFYDFNFRDQTSDPLEQTFVGMVRNGDKFVFPAEYEVYLDVSPYRGGEETADGEGNIAFTTYHTMVNPAVEGDRTWKEINREEYIVIPDCVDDNQYTDSAGDTCDWYNMHPSDCGAYDDSNFIAQHQCCVCKVGECQSTEQVDNSRDGCDYYGENPNACGWFATPDFDSGMDCCECDAGCYDNTDKVDTQGMGCPWYQYNKDSCGVYNHDFFNAEWDCCACRFRGCIDDPTKVDSGGDGCDWYSENTAACGAWNTD